MADLIDFNAERNRREQPDPQFVKKDEAGREMYCFLLSYDMADGQYGLQLWAYDWQDAKAKVDAMRASLRVEGQTYKGYEA